MTAGMYSEIIRVLNAIIQNQKQIAKEYNEQHKEILAEMKEIKEMLKNKEENVKC